MYTYIYIYICTQTLVGMLQPSGLDFGEGLAVITIATVVIIIMIVTVT